MESTITWIDHDQESRDRSLRILSFFQQEESRDELGLGGIRDSFSDQLFPGTSTVHTRLRYMLFIPWMYRDLEQKRIPSEKFGSRADKEERDLIEHLVSLGNLEGVFGAQAKRKLHRLPSSAYWTGLKKWNIRKTDMSQGQYHQMIDEIYEVRKNLSDQQKERIKNHDLEVGSEPLVETWHKLPPNPSDFPKFDSFELTREEAEFLCERIQSIKPKCFLASLTDQCGGNNAESFFGENLGIVELKDAVLVNAGFSDNQIEILKNAVMFSNVMYGAALVYNWQLSILKREIDQELGNNPAGEADDLVENYVAKLNDWIEGLDLADIQNVIVGQNFVDGGGDFTFSRFWQLTMGKGHTITHSTRSFVEKWVGMLLDEKISTGNYQPASELIKYREIELKKGKSRFTNRRVLRQWRGDSGLIRMNFRWLIARGYLKDLHEGLNN